MRLCGKGPARLAIQDPPYNFIAFERMLGEDFVAWLRRVVNNTYGRSRPTAALSVDRRRPEERLLPRCPK